MKTYAAGSVNSAGARSPALALPLTTGGAEGFHSPPPPECGLTAPPATAAPSHGVNVYQSASSHRNRRFWIFQAEGDLVQGIWAPLVTNVDEELEKHKGGEEDPRGGLGWSPPATRPAAAGGALTQAILVATAETPALLKVTAACSCCGRSRLASLFFLSSVLLSLILTDET